jgi:hypothetical protein
VPYSNQYVVAVPAGPTLPFRVAVVTPTEEAWPVTTGLVEDAAADDPPDPPEAPAALEPEELEVEEVEVVLGAGVTAAVVRVGWPDDVLCEPPVADDALLPPPPLEDVFDAEPVLEPPVAAPVPVELFDEAADAEEAPLPLELDELAAGQPRLLSLASWSFASVRAVRSASSCCSALVTADCAWERLTSLAACWAAVGPALAAASVASACARFASAAWTVAAAVVASSRASSSPAFTCSPTFA